MRRPWASEPTPARGRLWLGLGAVLAVALLTWALNSGGFSGGGRSGDADPADLPQVALADLPAQATQTVALIHAGGPFPYSGDGIVFHNYEGLLPAEASGYYHEYTVPTPGASDRGARRIIRGAGGELYWTQDHYRTFERISP
ncbi:MAG TPA: ribonuclease domain-containing protein [Nocardioides sp.]|uniref:ribonuclease domain-containing protein n=1 Tax=Nocardioides sp. TaxID=35761 RepID=UPI002E37B88E|nr:ribonuclease domain-containing protein [Nocardioides sp.]HEX3930668.1 ribonuclease domain-containing protein [Nocardioides sp.]